MAQQNQEVQTACADGHQRLKAVCVVEEKVQNCLQQQHESQWTLQAQKNALSAQAGDFTEVAKCITACDSGEEDKVLAALHQTIRHQTVLIADMEAEGCLLKAEVQELHAELGET